MRELCAESGGGYTEAAVPAFADLARKTRATGLCSDGVPLPQMKGMLGHERMSTTSTFYAFATLDMMAKATGSANPAAMGDLAGWMDNDILDALYSL